MTAVLQRILGSRSLARIVQRAKAGEVIKLSGVWGSSAPLLGSAVASARKSPVLFICPHLDDADAVADDVEVLAERQAELFPAWELEVPYEGGRAAVPADHVSDEIIGERLQICRRLAERVAGVSPALDGSPLTIVAPISALLQPVPSRAALAQARLSLRKGVEIAPARLAEWLVDAGFERVESVEQQGEFAGRGGIADVFAPGASQPVRVEFFGDRIESVRLFDLDTQRSTGEIDGFDVVGTAVGRRTDPASTASLLEYLPADSVVVVVEPLEVLGAAEAFARRLGGESGMLDAQTVLAEMRRFTVLEMSSFGPAEQSEQAESVIEVGVRSLQRLEAGTAEALNELESLARKQEVWVYCENPAERDRFLELLAAGHPELARRVRTAIGHIHRGFHWPAEKLAVVGHHEIFHRHVPPRRLRRVRAGRPIDSFVDLEEGDYVVHVAHGIARFEGLRTLTKDGRKEEYLTLKFAEGALLHVPVTQIQLVQKYIGARRGHPSLSHLGGTGWAARKQKVAEAVKDLAAELLRVQALRAGSPGVSYADETDWAGQFEREFPYEETEDQLVSMRQIFGDLAAPRPMDRLLCGDVGYGKTELAMRAAFRVVEAGRQATVLVPTTVLAAQHYRTFTERFADFPFAIDVISRFRTLAEQADILRRAATGKLDILIGTHRLLSDDVLFKDLGLVVVDEEQRFGVEHKERLKRLRATVDVLTLTATPIPRTLHMALMGLRDISNLTTAPLDRRAIYTEVCHAGDEKISAAILRELERGGQVYFVHNRVFNIEAVADHVRALVPEARVAVGHGQMHERQLERVMLKFVRGELDVLVCTTIVESGLDIPSANTMFVHEADRFGLAQLHQLRGRIGRYKNRAYCYLMLPKRRPVSLIAAKRLKAVEEFSDLGAGFQIAMRDLEIRGAGNILGAEQSGHIAAVGYELYCRMLENTVRQMRGEKVAPPREAHVELGVEAQIPRSYVASPRQRMEAYRRMALCRTRGELEQLGRDLADAFGPVPPAVETLLGLAEVRLLAGESGIDSIIVMPPDVIFSIRKTTLADAGLKGLPGSVRLADDRTAHWRPPRVVLEPATLLPVLLKHLRRAVGRL